MTKTLFSGTGVALITPFRKQDAVDFSTLEALINHIIESGVEYILETVAGRVPVVLGIGGNCTRVVIDTINQTPMDGIAGILSVTPYYNKPNQRGILQHYRHIADAATVPVIAYNVPGRTGVNISAETMLQIAEECPNVVAVKEASGNMSQIMEIIRCKPDGFKVISGDDALTLPMIAAGAQGVISVIANGCPKETSQMVRYALKGDFKKALPLHYKLLPLMHAIFEEGNPTGIKALLEIEGRISNNLRLPLVKSSTQLYNKISGLYNDFNK